MRNNKETLIKLIILICMIIFFGRLCISENILLFVHPRLIPFIKLSLILMFIICIFYMIDINKNNNKPVHLKGYRIFIIPLILAFLLDPASDIKNVQAEKNSSASRSNNTSIEGSTDNSLDEGLKENKNNSKDKFIVVNDDNYLDCLQELSKNIDKYEGIRIQIEGFVYKDENVMGRDFVCARNLMVCCAADMQIVGILCKDSSLKEYKADTWVRVIGTLRKNAGKSAVDVMYIEVDKTENIEEPKDKYVYTK